VVKSSFLRLSSPVQYIKGIGPRRAIYFKKIGVGTVEDLLFLVAHRYLDYSKVLKIKELKINDEVSIIGQILRVEQKRTRARRNLIQITLYDGTGTVAIKWFNRPDLKNKFKPGDWLFVSGQVTFFYGRQLINPFYEFIDKTERLDKSSGTILPIYPLTSGLRLWDIRRAVRVAIDNCLDQISETLPQSIIEKNRLMKLQDAVRNLHLPNSLEDARNARRRLVYDEFFFFELVLARRRAKLKKESGIPFHSESKLAEKFVKQLPFELTQGQKEIIDKIKLDMSLPTPMNRLLQGDVGSGKTVVAVYAMLIAVENGYQAALMAPTEILIEQHFLGLSHMLERLGVHSVLLTSSIKGKERNTIIEQIKNGTAQIIFGTHALIEGEVIFKRLGFVVVDEQHRFGVMQRAALVNKGINPDFLVLSATPIPRTLALTLYGDLDVSLLREKPPHRGEVVTRIITESEKETVFKFINQELKQGRQAFVVCPIIESSEKINLKSVKEIKQEMSLAFPDFRIEIIHGRLKSRERLQIMEEFRQGKIDVLVATTVIEVGVDIPNASIMLIEHPERFGLAQLHQLRGRIGRGAQRAYCFLFLNRYVSEESYQRIKFFEKNNDGFALAQQDMKIRGPGEILGKRQHGLPDIKLGDIEEDQDLLFQARDDAFALIEKDPGIQLPEHYPIRRQLKKMALDVDLLRIG